MTIRETDNLGYTRRNKESKNTTQCMLDTTMHTHTHTHTINVNKTCALQQTTGKTGTKNSLCEIDVNITNGGIFFTHHEQYYIDTHVQI